MNEKITAVIKYGTASAAAWFAVWLALELRGFSAMMPLPEKYCALADAFTIPGVILVMMWLLVLAASEGTFDGIGYVIGCAVLALFPIGRKPDTYADYRERKMSGRLNAKSSVFLFETGLLFLTAACGFTALFYYVQ